MRVDDTLSQERRITAGERVLGPLLFSVYVKEVPKLPGVALSMFADDIEAYAVDSNANYAAVRLQRQLDAYFEWADKWRVPIYPSKSTAVVFSKRRKPSDRLRIVRTRLPWANSVKYLGLHFDHRLTWRSNLSYVAGRINQRLRSLRRLLSSHNITRRLGQLIVTTYVVPMTTYAITVWGYIAKIRRKTL